MAASPVSLCIMPLDQHRLRYFVAIAETGSLSAAARRVGVAQPALSHHVGLLESQLDVRLFTRHSRGVVLTEPGERLLSHARRILEHIDDAYADLRSVAAAQARRVTIGLLSAPAPFLIPRILRAAAAEQPAVFVDIVEGDSELLRRLLREGRLDFAFNLADPARPDARPLAIETLYVAGPRESPFGSQAAVPFAEVLSMPLILPGPQNSLRKLVERTAAGLGLDVEVALQIDGVAPMRQAVSAGFGHTITSWPVIEQDVALGRMHASPIVAPELTRYFVLECAEPGQRHPAALGHTVEVLLGRLLSRSQEEVGWPRMVDMPAHLVGASRPKPDRRTTAGSK